MATFLSQLNQTNARIDGLRADFSGLENLNEVIISVLKRLESRAEVQMAMGLVQQGAASIESFDGWFEPLVKAELGKVLGIVRARAKEAAIRAGAGDAASAVLRRQYKDELKGNVNILPNGKRISYRTRTYPERTGGASGIRRVRTVSPRTKKLYEYAGPDRGFILRFLEAGTDVRIAKPDGPTGKRSQATYGNRGNIGARSFFGPMSTVMEQEAQKMGSRLVNYIEKWIDENLDAQ